MKETYPPPTRGKKPPAASVSRPAAKPNPRPSEAFGGSEEWEEAIFRHAEYFTVVRKLPREVKYAPVKYDRREYKSFKFATDDALDDPTAMLYAVAEGHQFCIPRSEWMKYQDIWERETAPRKPVRMV